MTATVSKRRYDTVDAGPARAHIRSLMAAGIGHAHAARLAGVPRSTVRNLLYGPSAGQAPTARVCADTARRLLAVTADGASLAGGAYTDATGTRRRLQALIACGWSEQALASFLSMRPDTLRDIVRGQARVTTRTARAVSALYDRLWDKPPPQGTPEQRCTASRSRNRARRNGWPVPMAWDDDEMDDPAAPVPAGWRRGRLTLSTDLAADFAELAARHPDRVADPGKVRADVARRLGITRNSLDIALARAARAAERQEAAA